MSHLPQEADTGKIRYAIEPAMYGYEIWLIRDGVKTVLIASADTLEIARERIDAYRRMREIAKSIGARIS